MASDKADPPANKNSSDENTAGVDIWEPHPKQQPVSQYWPTSAPDRRRPENAKMRHWMNLGDQALRDQETEKPDDSSQLGDETTDVNRNR
jgi:hypothetical protein